MGELKDDLAGILAAYTQDVQAELTERFQSIGKSARAQLRAKSPVRTGAYAKGWRVKQFSESGVIGFSVRQSAKQARLTHLLEEGHRSRSGSQVSPQPHIGDVQAWANSEAEKAIRKAVAGG